MHLHAQRGQLAIHGLGDVQTHAIQAAQRIFLGQWLVLVIVGIGDIHLTKTLGGIVAVDLGQHADLENQVTWNADIGQNVGAHREFAGQRIAIAVEIIQVRQRAIDLLERTDQRRDHQARHAAIQLALGDARVVALAELVVELRMGHRVDQARQQAAIIGDDIAVMQCHRLGDARGLHIA